MAPRKSWQVITDIKNSLRRKVERRQGVVTGIDAGLVHVEVSGMSVEAPVLSSYTPTIGDVVQIDVVSSQWLVLGAVSASAPNYVINPGFEVTTDGQTPAQWFATWFDSPNPALVTTTDDDPIAGLRSLAVESLTPGGVYAQYVASQPWPVTAGTQWTLSARVKASTAVTNGAKLYAWFGTSNSLGPGQPGFTSVLVATVTPTAGVQTASGAAIAPVGTTHMRLALYFDTQTSNTPFATCVADTVTARPA